jgi:glycosyltransferase involved in cell wall biosynthesis
LIPPRNATKLATTIIKLLSDDILAKEMGEYGRKVAKDKFDWEKIVKTYLRTYTDLIQISK